MGEGTEEIREFWGMIFSLCPTGNKLLRVCEQQNTNFADSRKFSVLENINSC